MLAFSVPPGYRRSRPPARPKLDPFIGIIDRILEDDKGRPKKQRHTAKRIFERLRDEHGYAGGLTIVKDYVSAQRQRQREVFVPLGHQPGHAQADFGEALAVIGGVERKIHFFAMDLPHSDACFVQAYPAETTEAFCDGHVAAFAFFGGVPQSILYDNTKIAVARILGDGTAADARVQRAAIALPVRRPVRPPGQGQRQGQGRRAGRLTRRNFMVPLPRRQLRGTERAAAGGLPRRLAIGCAATPRRSASGWRATRRLQRPAGSPYDACDKRRRVSSLSLVRYRATTTRCRPPTAIARC